MSWDYPGFSAPTYTQIPDDFFDRVMAHLSGAELRVLLYIMRRTFGFKKTADAISLGQFLRGIRTRDGRVLDEGCGLRSGTHLVEALRGLEEKGLIRRVAQTDAAGGDRPTRYALRFRHEGLPGGQEGVPDGYTGDADAVDPRAAQPAEGGLPAGQSQDTGVQETENNSTGNNRAAARARRGKSLSGRYYDLVHH